MKTKSSQPHDYLSEIQKNIHSYEFDQMVYVLRRLNQIHNHKDSVGMSSHIHMNWPPSDVYKVHFGNAESPASLEVNFMGLAGIQGPLPITISELILGRIKYGDFALKDFLDIFNQRLLQLLHEAHKKLNPLLDTQTPSETVLGRTILSISGLGSTHQKSRNHFSDRAFLRYAGLLWMRPRNAEGLIQVLTDYFGIAFKMIGAQGRWVTVVHNDQTKLGQKNGVLNKLGCTAALGGRAWDEIFYFIVSSRPLSAQEYNNFLPVGRDFLSLQDLLRYYVHTRTRTIVRLQIHSSQISPATLDGKFRLGWTSWLSGKSTKAQDFYCQVFV